LTVASAPHLEQRNLRTAAFSAMGALAMLGLGYASVPLYRLFCQVTGFAGTTQVASTKEADLATQFARSAGTREISIRFDASVARDLPWTFKPVQVTDAVQIGVRDLAFFTARNNSDEPITGTATFNVEPEYAGKYFNKIQCFCFTEQVLKPGQQVRMPVLYYVDPAILKDDNAHDLEEITLSYTFHRSKASS